MKRRLAGPLLMLVPLLAAASAPGDFRCANRQAEMRCADGACELVTAEQGFTPMQLARHGETLSLCVYSGCWEGRIDRTEEARAGVTLLQADVRRQGDDDDAHAADETWLSVLHDAPNRIAQMNWGGFANVMECEGAE